MASSPRIAELEETYDLPSGLNLRDGGSGSNPLDGPFVFSLPGFSREDDAVLKISNPQFPESVANEVDLLQAATNRVGADTARHILHPTMCGRHDQRSFAIWPRLQPLSRKRLIRKVQILSLHDGVFRWLIDIADASQKLLVEKTDVAHRYLEPLTFLAENTDLPAFVRQEAEQAHDKVNSGRVQAVSVLQHGDFWFGNLLLPRGWPLHARDAPRFSVIDWGGANTDGYPYLDLIRFYLSTGKVFSRQAKRMGFYSRKLQIPHDSMIAHVCAGLGWLGMHRNQFALENYIQLCDRTLRYAQGVRHPLD